MIKSLLIAPVEGLWRAGLQTLVASMLLALVVMAGAPDNAAAQTAAPAAKPKAQAAPSSEGGLKARVDSLEEQLVDMQVLVGTLESLARQGGAGGAPAVRAGGGADSVRVEALESQVRSLTQQVQALSDQVRSMGGTPRRSEAAPAPPVESFGTTSVQPGDSIGSLIEGDTVGAPGTPGTYGADEGTAGAPPPVTTAALPPPGELENPKQLYETAYGYLLQRDYGAAQTAFDDFLKKFPSDSLAGNAQYWLGESFFVRGQYKAAASAFLKGYQTYARSQKAPESLLKLAMSLDRLGQKDAACASYLELNAKFPNAPQNVKARAQSERQRVGCS